MEEMRQQAVHFGTEIVQGNVVRAHLSKRPFRIDLADGRTVTTQSPQARSRTAQPSQSMSTASSGEVRPGEGAGPGGR